MLPKKKSTMIVFIFIYNILSHIFFADRIDKTTIICFIFLELLLLKHDITIYLYERQQY